MVIEKTTKKKNALVKAISMISYIAHSVALNTYPISLCHENPSSAFKKRRRTESVKDRDRYSFRKKSQYTLIWVEFFENYGEQRTTINKRK